MSVFVSRFLICYPSVLCFYFAQPYFIIIANVVLLWLLNILFGWLTHTIKKKLEPCREKAKEDLHHVVDVVSTRHKHTHKDGAEAEAIKLEEIKHMKDDEIKTHVKKYVAKGQCSFAFAGERAAAQM